MDATTSADETNARTRQRARRGLTIYFTVLALVSGALEAAILRHGDAIGNHPGLVLPLMWTPALASLVARGVEREHPRDVSFGFGGKTGLAALGLALAYPLAVGVLAYGTAWSIGLERFEAPARHLAEHTPAAAFLLRLALASSLGALLGCISAAGEELGWRGYMLTRLIDSGVRRPVLVSGLVWAFWHLPLILSGQYAAGRHPWLSALLFVPSVVCTAYVAARLRLASGSIWPAILLHGAWNSIIQSAFDRYTAGGDASHGSTLWTGEGGILVVAASLLVTLAIIRAPIALRRTTRGAAERRVRLLEL